jgi:hypothetical protein
MNEWEALAALGRVVRRSPYGYASSWPLEEVELEDADGGSLQVLVKHQAPVHPIKPAFVCDPARESEAYRLLERVGLGTPRCYARGPGWLVIEKVPGRELWRCGELSAWWDVARWSAALHARFAGRLPRTAHLLRHDDAHYRRWVVRAVAATDGRFGALRAASETAIARLTALPRTLIHGELYPANVLVAADRVTAVDWEMAAAGPGVTDLAALVTGWGAEEQESIIRAYGPVDRADLAAARFCLATQWLGWSVSWRAPPEHGTDWFAEAVDAAESLR